MNILASSSYQNILKLYDLEAGAELMELPVLPDLAMSMDWNFRGDLLAATCKDKKMYLFDPRKNEKSAMSHNVHSGSAKPTKCCFLDGPNSSENHYVTTGFSMNAEREYSIWDLRNNLSPITTTKIDQGTSTLFPFFDRDTSLLFFAAKGDALIKYFEWSFATSELHYVDSFGGSEPQKGFSLFPKNAVDVGKHEVVRGIRLEATSLQYVSFMVPRKSDAFQEDLYPETPALEPSQSVCDWVEGENLRPPRMRSLRPGATNHVDNVEEGGASSSINLGGRNSRKSGGEKENKPKPRNIIEYANELREAREEIKRLREGGDQILAAENRELKELVEKLEEEMVTLKSENARLGGPSSAPFKPSSRAGRETVDGSRSNGNSLVVDEGSKVGATMFYREPVIHTSPEDGSDAERNHRTSSHGSLKGLIDKFNSRASGTSPVGSTTTGPIVGVPVGDHVSRGGSVSVNSADPLLRHQLGEKTFFREEDDGWEVGTTTGRGERAPRSALPPRKNTNFFGCCVGGEKSATKRPSSENKNSSSRLESKSSEKTGDNLGILLSSDGKKEKKEKKKKLKVAEEDYGLGTKVKKDKKERKSDSIMGGKI